MRYFKTTIALLLALTLMFALVACGTTSPTPGESDNTNDISSESPPQTPDSTTEPEETTEPEGATEPDESSSNMLVVYFSWSGNTETIAGEIQTQTGADIFELVPATPYSTDYNTVLDEAQAEQRDNARPEITGSIENIEDYDTIFVGFPNWWGDMPMILYTFFDTYDLSGKTIAPFVSSGGSGFSNTRAAMQELEPDATFLDGLSLSSSASASPADRVASWLSDIGISAD
ncbi:MAG: flavodoxin [Oscillospiraceae bacterium]|nr:flavodoxin [Oscillospiraceae bacterium]